MTAILLHHSSGRMAPSFSVPSSSGVQHESMKHLALSGSAIYYFWKCYKKNYASHNEILQNKKKQGMIHHFHISLVHLGTNAIPRKFGG